MLFSPQMFATVLTGALRLGQTGYQAYINRLVDEVDIRAYTPATSGIDLDAPPAESDELLEEWVIRQVDHSGEYRPGRIYEGLFQTAPGDPNTPILGPNGLPLLNQARIDLFEDALMEKALENQRRHDPEIHPHQIKQGLMVFHHKTWSDPNDRSVWGLFFREFIDVSLDVLALQPGLLGVGGNLEHMFAALVPNLAASYDASTSREQTVIMELTQTFGEAALQTLVDNPALVTSESRWAPLVRGVLQPIQEDVLSNGVNQLFAERRIRDLIGGPIAFNALSALAENTDEFLQGDLRGNTILGEIVRETLGMAISGTPEGFRIRSVFSESGATQIMSAALNVAKRNPELFLREAITDEGTTQGRALISSFADCFLNAPRPFDTDRQLAVELACRSLDVLSQYTVARLNTRAGNDIHKSLRADMAANVVSDLLEGFKRRLSGEQDDLLSSVFSREQVVEVMQIMASHIARSPHHFISDDANPQVVAIAEAIASAIAEDSTNLLTGDHWQEIIFIAMDAGLRNPGRLFSLDDDTPESSIALALIAEMLGAARTGMAQARADTGQLLFGDTLSEAIRVTLTAAASGTLAVIRDEAQRTAHIGAVAALMTRLNRLAGSDDPERVIGAADWLSIFTYYVAHVMESGPDSLSQITDGDLLNALAGGMISLNGGH